MYNMYLILKLCLKSFPPTFENYFIISLLASYNFIFFISDMQRWILLLAIYNNHLISNIINIFTSRYKKSYQ